MQDDRLPIRDYGRALWRLTQWSVSERYTQAQLDLAVQVVADVFWLSDEKVMHDLRKKVASVSRAPALPRRREVA